MDVQADQSLRESLRANEFLLWSGRPRQGLMFRRGDLFVIPFSILWASGAVSAILKHPQQTGDAPLPFSLFQIIFILAAIYITIGRFVIDVLLRSTTYYGVSSERILIRRGIFGKTTTSLAMLAIPSVELVEYDDGTATIWFESNPQAKSSAVFGVMGANCFERIPNGKDVYERIRDARKKAMTE